MVTTHAAIDSAARVRWLLLLLTPLLACYATHSIPLHPPAPEPEEPPEPEVIRAVVPEEKSLSIVTIGDEVFSYTETLIETPRIAIPQPLGLRTMPRRGWSPTHEYTGRDAPGAILHTNPEWYRGEIGIAVDEEGRTATSAPFVQVGGAKIGRRWWTEKGLQVFKRPHRVTNAWAIRFGGERNGAYYFELVDKTEPTTGPDQQGFYISPESLEAGFLVRKVKMKGRPLENGAVELEVEDVPDSW
jgi:hypothetical protein